MSVTYGFYNSIKGDRKYNALEMSSIFDGIIVDGVYMSIGDALNVKSSGGMGITVGIGRAWFNHTWTLNDSLLPLTLANSDVLLNRIDAIVLEVNNNTEVRKNTIKILKGTPSSKPVKPTMTEGELLNQHPLAYISIPAGATSISQSNIENAVGTSACPYVTGVLKGMDIDKLVAQWGAQWAEWLSSNTDAWKAFMSDNTNEWKSFMAKNKNEWSALINGNTSEFETWFEHMKDQLSEDAAGNLQLQVDNLNNAALGGDFVLKGSPVSVEYMGANRIASITAYGENAQGGTTEAPVALTGVDSVFVSGNNLLPKAVRTETTGGITFTPNPDGSILVSGTATTNVGYSYAHFERALLGRTVCLSGGSTQAQVLINERLSSGAFVRNVLVDRGQGISGILTKQKEDNILYATIQVLAGTTVNTTIYPMLNLGESPLPYEPYQGSVTQLPIPRPLRRVGDVKDKCITRQDYESAEKLVVTYNVGFVELDGTEDVVFDTYGNTQKRIRFDLDRNAIARYALKFSHGNPGDTPTVTGGISASFNRDVLNRLQIICSPDTWTALGVTDTATAKTWLAAQKAAGTPIQVAYQLATPETYATDPVDFDNAAGPLIIMTGGAVEVRMTELVGSRSPELMAKMDKATYDADGDGVVDEAEKVSNALTLKNAAGEVVATFDGSEAAILQLTAALVGALGKTEKAADSSKLAGLTPVIDNPGPGNRNSWFFPFTGTNNKDGTRKYYAALYADHATTSDRAKNLSMGLNGSDLWVYYS